MQISIPLFIADVHLGKLAKMLRMLGFDVAYSNSYSNAELVNTAQAQSRVLLSRNINFSKCHPSLSTFIVTHDETTVQLKGLLQHFHLLEHVQPFTRCMLCNGMLEAVSKETILDKLPEKTALYYQEFWQCSNCQHVYWKGPHYNRMIDCIEQLKDEKQKSI